MLELIEKDPSSAEEVMEHLQELDELEEYALQKRIKKFKKVRREGGNQDFIRVLDSLYKIVSIHNSENWKILIILSIVVNYINISYNYVFLREHATKTSYLITAGCDCLYILNFIIAITLKYCHRNISDFNVTYSRTRVVLTIDFLLAFPYSYIYELAKPGQTATVAFMVLRGISFLRLLHLAFYFYEKFNSAGIHHRRYLVVFFTSAIILINHTLAWMLYLEICPLQQKCSTYPQEWARIIGKENKEAWEWYWICIYMAFINATNANLGDLIPVNTNERIILIAAMTIGFILTTILIATLIYLFLNSLRTQIILRWQLQNIFNQFYFFYDNLAIKAMKMYYDTVWFKKKGVVDREEGLKILPPTLKSDLYFDANMRILSSSLIFRDKSEAFLAFISRNLKQEFYQPGELIYRENIIKTKMIFVTMGAVEIVSKDENPVIALSPGSCLGESALILTLSAKCSVRAVNYTEIKALYRKDFFNAIVLFPQIYQNICKEILERIVDIKYKRTGEVKEDSAPGLGIFSSKEITNSIVKSMKLKLQGANPGVKIEDKYLSLYNMKNNFLERSTGPLCISSKFPWIFLPNTSFIWCWEALIILIALFISFAYPYYIAFVRYFPPWLTTTSNFIELALVIDVVIILSTSIEGKEPIVKFIEILRKRLMQFGFYLDFLSALHLEIFAPAFRNSDRIYYVLKSNRLLKAYRFCRFFNSLERKLLMPIFLVRVVKCAAYLLILPYWFGTLLYLITCFDPKCERSGWFFKKIVDDTQRRISSSASVDDFTLSEYFAFVTFSRLNYGDILTNSVAEIVVLYLIVVIGILVFAYCIAQICSIMSARLITRAYFQSILSVVDKFTKRNKLRNSIRRRIRNFLLLQWLNDEGLDLQENVIFFKKGEKCRIELDLKKKISMVEKIPLFHGTDPDFIHIIASKARTLLLPPNEIVVYENGLCRTLYIIHRGYCTRRFGLNQSILEPGSYFDSINVLSKGSSMCSVKTLTHTELICITEEEFWRSISMFPEIDADFHLALDEFQSDIEIFTNRDKIQLNWKDKERLATKLRGSFINVMSYCKYHREKYKKPFKKLMCMCWLKFFCLPICILPNGLLLKLWMTFRCALAIFISVLTPYQILYAPYSWNFDKMMLVTDSIAYADLYIMMFVGYYGSKNQLIIHPLKTAAHYLKGRFIVDFLFCFPWELLVNLLTPTHNENHSEDSHKVTPHIVHCAVRLIRIGQIYRLPQLLNYFHSYIRIKCVFLVLLKYFFFIVVLVNFWAVALILKTCTYYNQLDLKELLNSTMARPFGLAQYPIENFATFCQRDSWMDRSFYQNSSHSSEVYMLALYFSTGTLLGYGFGDITPYSMTELIITMTIIIMGILLLWYFYASIVAHRLDLLGLFCKKRRGLVALNKFMLAESIAETYRKHITDIVEHKWKRSLGDFNFNRVLRDLHPSLHEDAVLNMYEKTLEETPLLEGVDTSFFRIFGKYLQEEYFYKREILIKAEDIVSKIYIIYKGTVEIGSDLNERLVIMGVGGVFGNLTLRNRCKITINATVLTDTDLLVIETEELLLLLEKYPSYKAKIATILQHNFQFMPSAIAISELDRDDEEEKFKHNLTRVSSEIPSSVSEQNVKLREYASQSKFKENCIGAFLICLPWKWCHVAIFPSALIYKFIDILCLPMVYANTVLVTYQFSFQHHTPALLAIALTVDLYFLIRLMLQMHKSYENEFGDLIISNRKIMKRFCRVHQLRRYIYFFIHFPSHYISLFLLLFATDPSIYFSSIRMITLLRFIYIVDFYKENSKLLMSNHLYLKISASFIYYTLTVHVLACIWFFLACPFSFCRKNTWLSNVEINNDMGKPHFYVACVYFIVEVLTKSTPGDILPTNMFERVYVIILMIMIVFLIAIFIGDVVNIIVLYSDSLSNYEFDIKTIKNHFDNNNASEFKMKKMWTYLQQLWSTNHGVQLSTLTQVLPYAIKCELMSQVYENHLVNYTVFSGTESTFIKQLCNYLKVITFYPGNFIVRHGDSDQSMYFIHRGEVEILTVNPSFTETVHEVLYVGDMFGLEQGLFPGIPHHFSFRAKTLVHVIRLCLRDWEDLLSFFPKSRKFIYAKASNVYSDL